MTDELNEQAIHDGMVVIGIGGVAGQVIEVRPATGQTPAMAIVANEFDVITQLPIPDKSYIYPVSMLQIAPDETGGET